jgi:tripartite-type tricarboxylate transporter receptor subunit TctC
LNKEKHAMHTPPLNRRHLLAAAGAASLWPSAWAQNYPDRPVKIIVGFAPAGPSDIMGRWLAQRLSERTGKSFVVENMAGAGGNIGMGAAAKAQPNGHTLLLASSTYVVNPSLYKSVPYDPLKDFAPISMVGESPHVFFVHPSVKAQSLRQLTDLVRSQPGKFSYVSAGSGTVAHLSVEQLKISLGLDMTHIPFKGAGPAVQSVVSGEIAIGCTTLPAVKELVRGGLLRALAVTSAQRFASSPQIPTVVEAGFADQESSTWQSLMAPTGTPAAVISFLQREVVAILGAPGAREQLVELGFNAIGNTPAQLTQQLQSEIERWRRVIQTARIEA